MAAGRITFFISFQCLNSLC